MADFSYLSDTDEDSAVEELISQTKDLCVLEQISAINCSSFTDSALPTHLESRFRKLKSFPLTTKDHPRSSLISPQKQSSTSKSELRGDDFNGGKGKVVETKQRDENPDGKLGFDANSSSGSGCCLDEGFNDGSLKELDKGFDEESECFEEKLDGERSLKHKKKGGFSLSPSASSDSSLDESILSANKKIQGKSTAKKSGSFTYGCFLCSPKEKKKKKKNKSKENRVKEMGLSDDWNMDDDEFLSGLGVLSKKESDKILKKAMKEEEKINREAEKIVQMAKQASARMNVSLGVKDELSDDD